MRILIVDDEPHLARVLKLALQAEGFGTVQTAPNAESAIRILRDEHVDLLVTDLRMPGMSGLELLADTRRRSPSTDVILMTAFAEVSTAREALTRGAIDYLVKPFEDDELFALVSRVQRKRVATERTGHEDETSFGAIVGRAPKMIELFQQIERAARGETSVLITGESGTGKELVARAVHDLSSRHRGPFVEVDCASLPEPLLESELFGHERGAFTGAIDRKPGRLEAATGGTVFLDEIGEMQLAMQPKLLRFLQDHQIRRLGGTDRITVDVRVVAATNRDLRKEVADGRFREDLLYRLDVVTLVVPPLRQRMDDLPVLVRHFLSKAGAVPAAIEADALRAMHSYLWPGNVRELENVIARCVVEADGNPIGVKHLPAHVLDVGTGDGATDGESPSGSSQRLQTLNLADNERHLIRVALAEEGGNKTRAAERLGITRRRLYSRMQRLDLDPDES